MAFSFIIIVESRYIHKRLVAYKIFRILTFPYIVNKSPYREMQINVLYYSIAKDDIIAISFITPTFLQLPQLREVAVLEVAISQSFISVRMISR